jgi:hypothetical protein
MSHFKFISIKIFNPFEALLNVFCTFNRLFSPLNALFQVQNPFQNSSQKLRHYFIPITYKTFGKDYKFGIFQKQTHL